MTFKITCCMFKSRRTDCRYARTCVLCKQKYAQEQTYLLRNFDACKGRACVEPVRTFRIEHTVL